jgi:hypothetical protein
VTVLEDPEKDQPINLRNNKIKACIYPDDIISMRLHEIKQ